MKFIAKKEELSKVLNNVVKIIPSKGNDNTLPYLKIDLTSDGLFFTGTNGEISIISKMPIVLDDTQIIRDIVNGSTLVNANLFNEIVKRIDGDELSFELIDQSIAKIQNETSDFKLNALNPDEYRDLDFSKKGIKLTLLSKNFIEAINQVAFAVSVKENNRRSLTGINIQNIPSKIIFTATDGARLARKELYMDILESINITIPAKWVLEVIRTIQTENAIDIYLNENKALFCLNNTLISINLIADSFPNTKNIIPKNFFYTLTVNSNELINAIDRVSLFAPDDRANIVKLTMNSGGVSLSSVSPTNGSGVETIKSFNFIGERLEISFNGEFVKNAIRALTTEEVCMNFLGEMKPFTITNPSDESVIQLITPVRTY
ncbi:MAG: DNA polymerase III subunit beta [Firmicutes bacterium]|uniref:Beta sliding clamp n=1 Tax=Candidatus Onthovivens merdipullorum TaxID=2840889 RepID=A0A9D9DIH6_9BACL|nr:DNA polymerase III subunit beta [Candidatus Onthovivens merdipullorum]